MTNKFKELTESLFVKMSPITGEVMNNFRAALSRLPPYVPISKLAGNLTDDSINLLKLYSV